MTDLRPLDHAIDLHPGRPWSLIAARKPLREAAREVDLVHAHGLTAGWAAVLARIPVPLVLSVHNVVLPDAAGRSAPVMRVLERALPRRVDRTIAVSQGVAERLGAAAGAVVIPPAGPVPRPGRSTAEVRDALGVAEGRPLVVCVARLHPVKDLHTLIAASAVLAEEAPVPPVVAIVGEGPLEADLRSAVVGRGLEGTVLLPGPSPRAADEIAAADVVVMCSRWESGPLVVAEAMRLARPVVATPVGFVPNLIEDGRSGRIVPVGDPRALAAAVAELLADPVGAAEIGRRGRERVAEVLDPERLVAEVVQVYEEVVRGLGR
jgi:glycosyltransferase involved in cell wall biosynthesis